MKGYRKVKTLSIRMPIPAHLEERWLGMQWMPHPYEKYGRHNIWLAGQAVEEYSAVCGET